MSAIEPSGPVEPIIRLREVSRRHGTPARPVQALAGVSLSITAGERVAIVGKSGSGKSSLLYLLGGLDRPTSGMVEVLGRQLGSLNSQELADFRLRGVGILFQSFHLISTRSAAQNVELPLIFSGVAVAQRRQRVEQALQAVGLGERLRHRPAELSGGEAQRVAIARALINEPPLILADEPTGNLDSRTASAIMDLLLAQIARLRATLVLVTHDEELAKRSTDRVLRMRDGLLVEEG